MNTGNPEFDALNLSDEEWDKWWKQSVGMMELSLGQDSAMPHLLVMYRDLLQGIPEAEGFKFTEPLLMVVAIGCDFHTTDEKDALMDGIARNLYRDKHVPVAAVFTCEAYTNHGQGKDVDDPSRVLPFDDPNATEALIAMGMRMGEKECRMCHIGVVRDKDNNMQRSGDNDESGGGYSRLLNVFWRGFIMEVIKHGTKE